MIWEVDGVIIWVFIYVITERRKWDYQFDMMLLTEFAKWGYLFRIQRTDDEIKVCNGVAVYDGLMSPALLPES